MTLLFAFFATMYAISSVDSQKLSTVAQALQVAFDDSAKRRAGVGAGRVAGKRRRHRRPARAFERGRAGAGHARSRRRARLRAARAHRRSPRRHLVDSGSRHVRGRPRRALRDRAATGRARRQDAGRFANSVRVEGHTDDVPIHNLRFASNWDLSAARASRVVEFLIARGLDPRRLSATGFAEFHPRVPNTSPETRASNRRIDLVILNSATTSAEEPSVSR